MRTIKQLEEEMNKDTMRIKGSDIGYHKALSDVLLLIDKGEWNWRDKRTLERLKAKIKGE